MAKNRGNSQADKGNVSQAFSLVTGGSVIGVDGELAYGAPIAEDKYNIYFPRLSNNQGGFHDISGIFNKPEGFIEYRGGEVYEIKGDMPSAFGANIHWMMQHGG